jgi:small-conductance mechanosensitive channel
MQATVNLANIDWPAVLIPFGVGTMAFLAMMVARRVLFSLLRRWSSGTKTDLDDIVIASIRTPFLLWALMLSMMAATWVAPISPKYAQLGSNVLLILLVLSITIAAARLAGGLVRHVSVRSGGVVPGTTLTQNIVSIVVASIGLLILLNSLGLSITPILTAMGVGGLAVALALQDTLANLFAGFYVSLSGQVKIGDYIKLDSGEEGTVQDIGWRTVSIRTLPNNMVIVPNAKLAQTILTNFSLPEQRMSVLIPIKVSYDCDPVRVEEVLLDEARKAAAEVKGFLSDPGPVVRFIPGFGDSSIELTLICHVAQFTDQFLVQHELRKRIFNRFRSEDIEIPSSVRTIHVRRDPAREDRLRTAGG